MLNQKYTLRYLPLFHEELESAVLYIANRFLKEKNELWK